jgi:hypothetical protein
MQSILSVKKILPAKPYLKDPRECGCDIFIPLDPIIRGLGWDIVQIGPSTWTEVSILQKFCFIQKQLYSAFPSYFRLLLSILFRH